MASTFDEFKRKSATSGMTTPTSFGTRFKPQQQPQQQQPPQPQPPATPTFSMLQQWGMARPAPPNINSAPTPTTAPAPTAAPAPQTGGLTPGTATVGMGQNLPFNLQALLGYNAQNPSRYTGDVVMDAYERMDRRLGDQFDVERQLINEDAARRGIYHSTIPLGRLGDVGIRQSQARSDLASSLLQDQAQTYGADRTSAIAQLMGYGQNQFSNQLDTARFNAEQDLANQYLLLQLLGYT